MLTLTTLSHPAETMTGLAGLGENRTHETLNKREKKTTQSQPLHPPPSFPMLPSHRVDSLDSPLRVTLLLDVKLALSQSVPKLDRLVPRSGDDLPVVGRERDGQDVGGVTDESSSGRSGVQVPKSEGVVPRRGEGELT
jgi:hypothetical protein